MSPESMESAETIFNRHAREYQERFGDVSAYRESLDLFCDALPGNAPRVLECACGPGNVSRYLLSRRPQIRLRASDIAANMIELARALNPEAEFFVMDARRIGEISSAFEGLVCAFGLPYLSKEEALHFIAEGTGLLIPGGLLYLSTMEAPNEQSGPQTNSKGESLMLYYHEAEYLIRALQNAGMQVIHQNRQDFHYPDGRTNTDLILIAQKTEN